MGLISFQGLLNTFDEKQTCLGCAILAQIIRFYITLRNLTHVKSTTQYPSPTSSKIIYILKMVILGMGLYVVALRLTGLKIKEFLN